MTTPACIDSSKLGFIAFPALKLITGTVGVGKCEIMESIATNGSIEVPSAQVLFSGDFFEMIRVHTKLELAQMIKFEIFRESDFSNNLKNDSVRASRSEVSVPSGSDTPKPTPTPIFLNLNVFAPVHGILRGIIACLRASVMSLTHTPSQASRLAIIRPIVGAWHPLSLAPKAPRMEMS